MTRLCISGLKVLILTDLLASTPTVSASRNQLPEAAVHAIAQYPAHSTHPKSYRHYPRRSSERQQDWRARRLMTLRSSTLPANSYRPRVEALRTPGSPARLRIHARQRDPVTTHACRAEFMAAQSL